MSVPVWRHVLVVAFLVLIWGLGAQGLVREDSRYAWGMFSTHIDYSVDYRIELADGGVAPYAPAGELRHKTWAKLSPGRPMVSRYGIGGTRALVGCYLQWILEHNAPPDATAAAATIRYRVNRAAEREVVVRRERARGA